MATFFVSICNMPIPGTSAKGQLTFTRKYLHFHRSWWQFPEIDIFINYRDIVDVQPSSHLFFFPAVDIHLVCGTVYKFSSFLERDNIIKMLRNLT